MEKKIRWMGRTLGPQAAPRAVVLHCRLGSAVRGAPLRRDGRRMRHRRWGCARGPRRRPSRGTWSCPAQFAALVAALARCRHAGPGRPWGGLALLGRVGNRGLPAVPRLHAVFSASTPGALSARGPRGRVVGLGSSEPYLLFLKKSLIAFCNCTVDKCSKSP